MPISGLRSARLNGLTRLPPEGSGSRLSRPHRNKKYGCPKGKGLSWPPPGSIGQFVSSGPPGREAAARVAIQAGIQPDWLNAGVKGFLSERGAFSVFLELDHLRVMVAQPEYLLAMTPQDAPVFFVSIPAY